LEFVVSREIWRRFPDFLCGAVVCRGADNSGESNTLITLLREAESDVRRQFTVERLSDVPYFASWRRTYAAFGTDPTKSKCSSEALVRRVLKGNKIRHINKLVDAYNYLSLKYRTPVGGEDLASVRDMRIELKIAEGREHFVALGEANSEPVEEGEVAYVAGNEVLCRRWNWRESEITKLTEATKDAFLVIDALPPLTKDDVNRAARDLAELVSSECGAKTTILQLDAETRYAEW
jgi:DNA/RNA-binding domain of Phe-tRNA-synthetase-like protein